MKKSSMSGLLSKRTGDYFEKLIQYQANRVGCAFEKIPSGAKWISARRVIPMRTPFDFIVAKGGKCAVFDAKMIDSDSFPKSMIKPHQLKALLSFHRVGIPAGYVIAFSCGWVEFFNADILFNLRHRQSLKAGTGVYLGERDCFDLTIIWGIVKVLPV